MDMDTGAFYFIEVNPRVQVEHTVTEEVTGIDIVQAQIMIAEGKTLAEATGKASAGRHPLNGHALQTRITTEDPPTTSSPITAASPPTAAPRAWASGWMAARPMRAGSSRATTIRCWSRSPPGPHARKGHRADGPRVARIPHPRRVRPISPSSKTCSSTRPSSTTSTPPSSSTRRPSCSSSKAPRPGTKVLTYIADITVNGHPEVQGRAMPPPI